MTDTQDYFQKLYTFVLRKYDLATKAGSVGMRQGMAALVEDIGNLSKKHGSKQLPDACTELVKYFTTFDYSTLKEDHPACVDDIKKIIDQMSNVAKAANIKTLDTLL